MLHSPSTCPPLPWVNVGAASGTHTPTSHLITIRQPEVEFRRSPKSQATDPSRAVRTLSPPIPMPRVETSPAHKRHTPNGTSATGGGSSSRPKACKRCHARKRKCDGARPRCAACRLADVGCDMEWKVGDQVQTLQADLSQARQRNSMLERRIRDFERALTRSHPDLLDSLAQEGADSVSVSESPLFSIAPRLEIPPIGQSTISGLVSAIRSFQRSQTENISTHLQRPGSGPTMAADAADFACLETSQDTPWLNQDTPDTSGDLPPLRDCMDIIVQFCQDLRLTNQVTSLPQLKADLKMVYSPNGMVDPSASASRFRMFSVLLLSGAETLGYANTDNATLQGYRQKAVAELPWVLQSESLTCVQALTILALIELYHSGGAGLWQILGVALRTAVSLNLHRQDSVFLAPYQAGMAPEQLSALNLHRTNIFWSIYVLERLSTITFGRPSMLRDQDIDVDLPALPPGSLPFSVEANFRHGIMGRRIHAQICEALYGVSVTPVSQEEGEALISGLETQIQLWYASSPLKTACVPISEATIKRQFIIDIQYQQMITMLYRPSSLIPQISSSSVLKLYDASSMALQLLEHYCAQKRVILHWSHMNHAFIATITLIHCFGEFHARQDLIAIPEDQMLAKVEECHKTLARFDKWLRSGQHQALDGLLASVLAKVRGEDPTRAGTDVVTVPTVEDVVSTPNIDFIDTSRDPLGSEQYLDPLQMFSPSFWDGTLSWVGNNGDLSCLDAEYS